MHEKESTQQYIFSDNLWASIQDIYKQILESSFIRELTAGTLDRSIFAHYLQQDALYLNEYSRALARIGTRATQHDVMTAFFGFAHNVLSSEKDIHIAEFRQFAKTQDNEPTETCLRYTQFLMKCAGSAPIEVAVAAVLPCFWIYRDVCRDIAKLSKPNNPFINWINAYASEDFHQETTQCISILNQLVDNADDELRERVCNAFKTAAEFELAFWNSAYDLHQPQFVPPSLGTFPDKVLTSPITTITKRQPIVWTIAGSDSGGGAGIQADLKTFQNIGVYGCSVITAITAQNSIEVDAIAYSSADIIQAQLAALAKDLSTETIKIGMIGSIEAIEVISKFLETFKGNVIVDPVMVTTSGSSLMDVSAKARFISDILPYATLLTPNLPEAGALLDREVNTRDEIIEAAQDILKLGAQNVLIKGGHSNGDESSDYFMSQETQFWVTNCRIKTQNNHGSGCTFASAIAAYLALGNVLQDAIVLAKTYVHRGIKFATQYGQGAGPVSHLKKPFEPDDFPWVSTHIDHPIGFKFKPYTPVYGFYPIVPSSQDVMNMAKAGARTIQLRIKKAQLNDNAVLEQQIRESITIAKKMGVTLFINDHWELALKYGAEGIHLGHEDITPEALHAIHVSGIYLGLSISNYTETAIVKRLNPSYVGVGPIYTTSNKIKPAMGLTQLQNIKSFLDCPVVAIGGITLENLDNIQKLGVAGVAVISAVLQARSPTERAKEFMQRLCPNIKVQPQTFDEIISLDNYLNLIRDKKPLVHNITNFVVMEKTANMLLSVGASPIMAHAPNELKDIANIANALVINMGTLDNHWCESMKIAIQHATEKGIPIIFDPVGAGATSYRTERARELIASGRISVIRGNASEIMALVDDTVQTKGVDSQNFSDAAILAGIKISKSNKCVVVISGPKDFIIKNDCVTSIGHGHEMMTQVTGMGCSATAIIGAFCAVNQDYYEAAFNAMLLMGLAGELALHTSSRLGDFSMNFISELQLFSAERIKQLNLTELKVGQPRKHFSHNFRDQDPRGVKLLSSVNTSGINH